MECLEGRRVQYVYGAHHGEEEGVIVEDRGKGFALNNQQLVAVSRQPYAARSLDLW